MLDFVRLFISDEFIDDVLVRETNKYAADFFNSPQERNLKPHSHFHKWVTN